MSILDICCINTALIMAIFAEQRNKIEVYFDSLVKKRDNENKNLLNDFK